VCNGGAKKKFNVGEGQIAESIQVGEQTFLVNDMQARCAQWMGNDHLLHAKLNRQMEKK
jgi:hypothetical protein